MFPSSMKSIFIRFYLLEIGRLESRAAGERPPLRVIFEISRRRSRMFELLDTLYGLPGVGAVVPLAAPARHAKTRSQETLSILRPSGTFPLRAPQTLAGAAPVCSSQSGRTMRLAPGAAFQRQAETEYRRRRPAPSPHRLDQTVPASDCPPGPAASCQPSQPVPSAPQAAATHCKTSRRLRRHKQRRCERSRPEGFSACPEEPTDPDRSDRLRSPLQDRSCPKTCRRRLALESHRRR